MTDKETDVFYIGVKEPSSIRRTLLESSKTIVEGLQRYENFKMIREQKEPEIFMFKEDMREINKLMMKLKVILPKTNLKEVVRKEKKGKAKKIEEKPIPKIKIEKKVDPTELQKLESDLADIERKLARLG